MSRMDAKGAWTRNLPAQFLATPSHNSIEQPGYGSKAEADLNDARVNMAKYKRASMATRSYAQRTGRSKITATKALSETVRDAVDYNWGVEPKVAKNYISRGLDGMVDRLGKGRRGGQTWKGQPMISTAKGDFVSDFSRHLSGKPVTVVRPKTPIGTMVTDVKKAASIIGKLK